MTILSLEEGPVKIYGFPKKIMLKAKLKYNQCKNSRRPFPIKIKQFLIHHEDGPYHSIPAVYVRKKQKEQTNYGQKINFLTQPKTEPELKI